MITKRLQKKKEHIKNRVCTAKSLMSIEYLASKVIGFPTSLKRRAHFSLLAVQFTRHSLSRFFRLNFEQGNWGSTRMLSVSGASNLWTLLNQSLFRNIFRKIIKSLRSTISNYFFWDLNTKKYKKQIKYKKQQ